MTLAKGASGPPSLEAKTPPAKTSMALVVLASSVGTAFEWYDFFVFGALSPIIAKNFFSALDATSGLLAALALFGAGFFFRPVGALIFGRLGDRVGRKSAFLITVSMMGLATFAIGLLPTYAQAGALAPVLLVLLRIVQGMALGGEWGGAAIFVAEHAPSHRRGFATGFIQSSAAFGLVGALGVILLVRGLMGETAFAASSWEGGWRIPFLVSAVLLAISIWIRLSLSESPAFAALKAEGRETRAPYSEAFGQWSNLRMVLAVLVAFMFAQGAAWYTLFFYAEQVFLERFLKLDPLTGTKLLIAATVASAPCYIFFGWLSDKVGRKWVMWGGMTLALLAFFPGFRALTHFANPALEAAQARTPVVVEADPARCAVQFDIVGKAKFASSCDLAKTALSNAGISYTNRAAPRGSVASVRIGDHLVASREAAGLAPAAQKAASEDVRARLFAALKAEGYPARADPARVNFWALFGVLMVFVIACTALFGPIASTLVEVFPTRVRYTALSLPYHVGTGWVGGFLPVTAFAIVTATGDIYSGLWYPVVFTGISVLTLPLLIPETSGRPLDA
jgi:MFS family permease